ncbi:MAG: YciI family protein [Candidatus Kapaibacterium sp.]
MLLIRTEGDYCAEMPADVYKEHIGKVSAYIAKLSAEGRFRSAQPLHMQGSILAGIKGAFKDGPFIESKEVIAGYFLVLANDHAEALEIAKANPIFEVADARIEIRLIKHEEGING